jgi:hypothetical protein
MRGCFYRQFAREAAPVSAGAQQTMQEDSCDGVLLLQDCCAGGRARSKSAAADVYLIKG